MVDVKTGKILYFDVNLFPLHLDFISQVIVGHPLSQSEKIQFQANYGYTKPSFIMGYISLHQGTGTWCFSFWEMDRIQPPEVERVYSLLQASFFREDLAFRPDSTLQESLIPKLKGVPTITNDRLYKNAPFQSFNNGEAVGTLRIVPKGTPYESLSFNRGEIVILQEIYPDLSPVAGIISALPSTPLSHINLRAQTWGAPNASLINAPSRFKDLDGTWVHLEVTDLDLALRPATPEEVASATEAHAGPKTLTLPPGDLSLRELTPLALMSAEDSLAFGAKAANLGHLITAGKGVAAVPAGFGIPFSRYVEHLRNNDIDDAIEVMLEDPRFEGDGQWRREALEALRAQIEAAPIDPELLKEVARRVETNLGGAVFVRSSTNAEDLEGFNGAGLYDTVPNVRGTQALGEAIKQVWASLWNLRAVEERALFGIDNRGVYGGVLVQRGVPATAAGVLITANLYDPQDDHSYTINAKWGLGMKVVQGTTVPEQVIYDVRYPGARVISRSDDATMLVFDKDGGIREVPAPAGEPVLTARKAKALSMTVLAFKDLYDTPLPLDVEWLFEGDTLWIVQVRPYMGGS